VGGFLGAESTKDAWKGVDGLHTPFARGSIPRGMGKILETLLAGKKIGRSFPGRTTVPAR